MALHHCQQLERCYRLSDEFLVVYPQPPSCYHHEKKNRTLNRNANAIYSNRCKAKSLLHPYKQSTVTSDLDDEMRGSTMANGDNGAREDLLDQLRQQTIIDEQTRIMEMMPKDLIRPVPIRSNLQSNRSASWRKLQANIVPSHFQRIQEFQRDRRRPSATLSRPIMMSPMHKQTTLAEKSDKLSIISNDKNFSSSSSSLIDYFLQSSSNTNDEEPLQSANVSNSEMIVTHASSLRVDLSRTNDALLQLPDKIEVNHSIEISPKIDSTIHRNPHRSLLFSEEDDVEEIQVIASPAPSLLLNDILASFFPLVSTSSSKNPFGDIETNELLIIGSPSISTDFYKPIITEEQQQQQGTKSLSNSIEELCILIRKLFQKELSEQKTRSLQTTITNQLAILLTYLASRASKVDNRKTIERMTSTEDLEQYPVSSVETQTNIEHSCLPIHSSCSQIKTDTFLLEKQDEHRSDVNEIESNYSESSSFEINQEKLQTPVSPDSISTSVPTRTLNLRGRTPRHALSDSYIDHLRQHEQHSSSLTTMHCLRRHHSLLSYIRPKFSHWIELKLSNTCFEASTEFTPDFLLTTINSTKEDEDQTEQFGIDTERQADRTGSMSLMIDGKIEKDNLEIFENEQPSCFADNHCSSSRVSEFDGDENDALKSSVSELLSLDDETFPPLFNQAHLCQLLQPLTLVNRWQVPISVRTTNDDRSLARHMAKMDSTSNDEVNIVGKRVRVRSTSSSRASTSIIKPQSNREELGLVTIDSMPPPAPSHCDRLNCKRRIIVPKDHCLKIDRFRIRSKSDEFICPRRALSENQNNNHLYENSEIRLRSKTTHSSSHLSEITAKFESNIALAESVLCMLDSLNNNNNSDQSRATIELLHTNIRQFLIHFDARICHKRKTKNKKKSFVDNDEKWN